MRSLLRKVFVVLVAGVLALSSVGSVGAVNREERVKDMGEDKEQWYDFAGRNHILFYEPCVNRGSSGSSGNSGSSGGTSSSEEVTILPGNNVAEKIWNWFASAGIAGVSDNPNLIAGVIGNLMTEAGGNTFDINPFVVSPYGYYGMYQAGGGRATSLQSAFDAAGLGGLWGSSPSSVSEEVLDKAIDVTLTHLVNADDGSFRTFASATPGSETAEAYSDLFLVIVERAVGGDSPILDPEAKNRSSGGDYQASEARRNNAAQALTAFSGNTGSGASTIIRDETIAFTQTCSSSRQGGGGGGEGEFSIDGLTEELAWLIANYYNSGVYAAKNGYGLNNCVELVLFFVNELTTKGGIAGLPDGGLVAGTLANAWGGAGGDTPEVWSVFSNGSHTGVVVGSNGDGTYITIEAAWPSWADGYSGGAGNARVYSNKTFGPEYNFAYFGGDSLASKMGEIIGE